MSTLCFETCQENWSKIQGFRKIETWNESSFPGFSSRCALICVFLSLWPLITLAKKNQKSCLSEFFPAKSTVVAQKEFPPGWSGWKDSIFSFKLRSKSQIWAIFGSCVQHSSHSRASALVQLASMESSDPFYAGGLTRKSLLGPGGPIQEHLL